MLTMSLMYFNVLLLICLFEVTAVAIVGAVTLQSIEVIGLPKC
jgi:nitrate reductase NapE component